MSDRSFRCPPEAGKSFYKAPKVLLDIYVAIRSQSNPVFIPVVSKVKKRAISPKEDEKGHTVKVCCLVFQVGCTRACELDQRLTANDH